MRQHVLWLTCLSLAGCYFSPDKHREQEDVTIQEAGVDAADASGVVTLDGSMDARVVVDASDSGYDAGCSSDLQCPLAFPQCRNGDCVPCAEQNDCSRFADTPNCGASGKCVVCTSDHTQLCTTTTPACDPNTNACVQCVGDTDCLDDSEANCGANRSCGACTEDADCTRFGKVCNTGSGACVQCRPETEATDCKTGTACNPKTFTCTTRQRGSVQTCNTCESDSECITDHRCIEMTFGAQKQALGGFCLKRFATGCVRGYTNMLSRQSINGVSTEVYCGLNELENSCAALGVARQSKSCTSDESCGVLGGRCETVTGLANICTYTCASAADCVVANHQCGTESYCGGT